MSQIFNVNSNQIVYGIKVNEQINNYQDEYKDRYISLLEEEIKRLKNDINAFSSYFQEHK